MSTSVDSREPAEKGRGALLGAALGDAAGWPQEPAARRAGKRSTGEGALLTPWERRGGTRFLSYAEPIAAGEYSDDTQLLLCTARSLSDGSEWFRRLIEVEIPTWTLYERGGGGATKRAATSWLGGAPPWLSGDAEAQGRYANAGGTGVAMRIVPHCLGWSSQSWRDLASDIFLNGIATHGHPRALLGGALHGFVLRGALEHNGTLRYGELVERAIAARNEWSVLPLGSAPEHWLKAVGQPGHSYEQLWSTVVTELDGLLALARSAIEEGALALDRSVLDRIGATSKQFSGAGTVNAVAALFLASRYAAEPMLGLRRAAFAYPADTDTLASMTASILGALHGTEWIRGAHHQLQDADYIASFAERLAGPRATSTKADSRKPVTAKDRAAAERALVKAERGTGWSLPDGRRGEILSVTPLKTANATATATMWIVRLEDGQTIHITKTSRVTDGPSNPREARASETRAFLPVQQAHAGIRVPVADLARSTRFYCDVLGLRVTQQSAGAVRLDGFLSLVPDSDASLLPTKASPARWRAIVHVQTPSIAEVWANVLAFAGGAPTSIAFVGPRRYFRCEDPDGNIVEVVDVLDGRERDSEASPGQLGFSLDNGHEALRNRSALTLTPRIVGGRVLLSVTNHSESSRFAAQVTAVAGSEENVAVPWSVPWQDSTDEFRTIQREQTQLLVLAEADGMGFPLGSPPPAEWQPGAFWFETSSRRFRARLSNLRSTDEIYTKCLSIRIEVRDAPGRIALIRELELGFDNANDPSTSNLRVRASIRD